MLAFAFGAPVPMPASAQRIVATDFTGTDNGRASTDVRFLQGPREIGSVNFVLTYDPRIFAAPVAWDHKATCTVNHALGRITGVRPLNPGVPMGTELLCRIDWTLQSGPMLASKGQETSMRLPEVGATDVRGIQVSLPDVTDGRADLVTPPGIPPVIVITIPGMDPFGSAEPTTRLMLLPPPPSPFGPQEDGSADIIVGVGPNPFEPSEQAQSLKYTPIDVRPGDAFVGDWQIVPPARNFRLDQAPNLLYRAGDPPSSRTVRVKCKMQGQEQRALLYGDFWSTPGGRLWRSTLLVCPADPNAIFADDFE